VGKCYAEESREPFPGDLHVVTLLRADYLAVDPYKDNCCVSPALGQTEEPQHLTLASEHRLDDGGWCSVFLPHHPCRLPGGYMDAGA
jgi:hypothetical protein